MKRLLLVGLILALPAVAAAQRPTCPTCVLGLWDDADLTSNYGAVSQGVMKDIYLGIKLTGVETGITALEFSIYGMRNDTDGIIITATNWTVMPPVMFGSINAPTDSSRTSTGTGGMQVGWTGCLAPLQGGPQQVLLARIQFLSFAAISNKIFTVMHAFPTSNVDFDFHAAFSRCDAPVFTSVLTLTSCYVANWDGTTVLACDRKTPVLQTHWTAVKQLFN